MEHKQISYTVNKKEKIYFTIKILASLVLYPLLAYGLFSFFTREASPQLQPMQFLFKIYAVVILGFIVLRRGLMIGYLKNNAVKITSQQFPDIYEIVEKQALALGMKRMPNVYLLQAGGLLNAFATSFMGTNYVVIYSDIMDEAYENNLESVEFIIGHELGHVKRKHMLKRFLLFPSALIPFLNMGYSRACEYTCDSIGAALSPKGARNGLIMLASGKRLYKRVNAERFMFQETSEDSFWSWFAEKLSTHPKLTKRVAQFKDETYNVSVKPKAVAVETIDHAAYFPKN